MLMKFIKNPNSIYILIFALATSLFLLFSLLRFKLGKDANEWDKAAFESLMFVCFGFAFASSYKLFNYKELIGKFIK